MARRLWISLVVVAVVLVTAAGAMALSDARYELKILMPSAEGLFAGSAVMERGSHVGEVTDIEVKDGQALVTIDVDDEYAPMREGTTARVSWQALLGARVLNLLPGSATNPEIPAGKMIVSEIEQVEIDDVLAALDPPTRKRLQGFVSNLRGLTDGRERELQATLKSAGPSVHALGEVLRAVGDDGPAIRSLITRLREMTGAIAERRRDVGQSVSNLGVLLSETAAVQKSLTSALVEMPPTVRQATGTLERVPGAVDEAVPLLVDLRPGTAQLPSVSRNLSPVLQELRPTVADLRQTLGAANRLLANTPALLDTAHRTLPGINEATTGLQPAVSFLRPYTPELVGWLSNWNSLFASQSSGNYARAVITESATSFNDNPGVLPPGFERDPRPAPGSIAGQPWTDANGDGVR